MPENVRILLHLRKFSFLTLILPFYKLGRFLKLDGFIKSIILPAKYKEEIKGLQVHIPLSNGKTILSSAIDSSNMGN